jgi:hypothetical protein
MKHIRTAMRVALGSGLIVGIYITLWFLAGVGLQLAALIF